MVNENIPWVCLIGRKTQSSFPITFREKALSHLKGMRAWDKEQERLNKIQEKRPMLSKLL